MSKNHGQTAPAIYSQNFLTSQKTIARVLRLTDIRESDSVLEIGAGKGHITRALIEKRAHVTAWEIDRRLCKGLEDRFSGAENLRLISGDFLRGSLPKAEYKVFANIPFNLTTAIIHKLTLGANTPKSAWLVMEKGAAKRFCGMPHENYHSLSLKPFFDLNVVYHFRREDFHPVPGVDVVLLRIRRKDMPDIPMPKRKMYRDFLAHGLTFGLWGGQALLTKHQVSTALRLAGLGPLPQCGQVLYIQWLCLFRCWAARG